MTVALSILQGTTPILILKWFLKFDHSPEVPPCIHICTAVAISTTVSIARTALRKAITVLLIFQLVLTHTFFI